MQYRISSNSACFPDAEVASCRPGGPIMSRKSCSRRKYYAKKKAASPVPVPNKKKADSFKTSGDFLFKFQPFNHRKGRKVQKGWPKDKWTIRHSYSITTFLQCPVGSALHERASLLYKLI